MTTRQAYPTGWQGGGVYAGDNYDELLKYQITLHRQGEGIFSPDRDELRFGDLDANRRLIQSIMGDIAIGDAFNIIGSAANNDFSIQGGDGTADGAFHFYLRGYHVIIETSTTYLDQNTDLNASLVPAPTALTVPAGGDRTDEVYLDIFLKRVTGVEDPPLVPTGEAQSKTDRLRLISQVFVAEGATTPADYIDGDNIPHFTVKLATLERFDGQDAINAVDLTDLRRQISASALGGEQEGGSVPAFNPSAMKILSQVTPDDTVRLPTESIIISTGGLRVIDVQPQNSSSLAPASIATNTRLYMVHINDAGFLDSISFNEVVTATLDVFIDAPDIDVAMQGLAIVRVDGDGPVTITQNDIYDIRHWLNKGGAALPQILPALVDRFTVPFGFPQSVFNLTFSAGSEDDLIMVRNGQILFAEGNAPTDDYFLSTPTQVTITNPSIPGTLDTETIMAIPRLAFVESLVVTKGSDTFVAGDGTKGPYVLLIPDWTAGEEMVFVGGVIQDASSYLKTGIREITFGVTGVTPTVSDEVRVIVRPQVTSIGAALESLAIVVAGAGTFYKSLDTTQRLLRLEDSGRMSIDSNEIALLSDLTGGLIDGFNHSVVEIINATLTRISSGGSRIDVTGTKTISVGVSDIDIVMPTDLISGDSETADTWYAVVVFNDTVNMVPNAPIARYVTEATFTGGLTPPAGYDSWALFGWARNDSGLDLTVGIWYDTRFMPYEQLTLGTLSSTSFVTFDPSSFVSPDSSYVALSIAKNDIGPASSSVFTAEEGRTGSSGGRRVFQAGTNVDVNFEMISPDIPLGATGKFTARKVGQNLDALRIHSYVNPLLTPG